MGKKIFRGEILLCLTAIIWGTAFVAQRKGMEYIGPFTFSVTRLIIGALALLLAIFIMYKCNSQPKQITCKSKKKDLLFGGISCGVVLFFAVSFQQVGIVYTTAGKAAFNSLLLVFYH